MNKPIHWVTDRAKEPSTWAGIAAIATAIGQLLAGDIHAAVSMLVGVVAVVLKEKGQPQ